MGYYDIAQICLNGHVITEKARGAPEFAQKFCKKCGESTITECQSCRNSDQRVLSCGRCNCYIRTRSYCAFFLP